MFLDIPEDNENYQESFRPMTPQQRISKYRALDRLSHIRVIEAKLSSKEVALLDALASKAGMSRVLFVSKVLKDLIYSCGYSVEGGNIVDLNHF